MNKWAEVQIQYNICHKNYNTNEKYHEAFINK